MNWMIKKYHFNGYFDRSHEMNNNQFVDIIYILLIGGAFLMKEGNRYLWTLPHGQSCQKDRATEQDMI